MDAVVQAATAALDADTQSYLTAAASDCHSVADVMELLQPFLDEAGTSDEELERLRQKIERLLGSGGKEAAGSQPATSQSGGDAAATSSATTRRLAAPVVMGADAPRQEKEVEAAAAEAAAAPAGPAASAPAADTLASAELETFAAPPRRDNSNLLVSTEDTRFHLDRVGDSEEVYLRGLEIVYEGSPPLIEGAELRLSPGHRYCLLGSNGSGKSTLLRCIAEGSIPRFPSHIHVLYIDQDARTPAVPAIEYVIAGDGELRTLQSERAELAAKAEQTEADANRLAEIEEELHIIDAATAETRAAAALRALGFAESQIHARLDTLSGGWRVKCSLARALFCPPRFLLLDEPTNHLDLHEILRLQRLLLQLDEMCTVIVSHDQAFVDAVATDVIVLKDRKLQYFKGNLSAYLKDKEDRLTKQQRLYDNQERKRAHLQATIDRGIQTAKKTGNDKVLGMVASRKKKLEERLGAEKREDGRKWKQNTRRNAHSQKQYETNIDGARREIEAPKEDKLPTFKFLEPPPLLIHGACIQLEDVSFSYPNSSGPVLEHVSFSVEAKSRIGILGRNGAGKSTLVGLLMGTLTPTDGEVTIRRQANVQLFNQHHAESLAPHECPLKHMMRLFPTEREQTLRNHLGSFGVGGSTAMLSNQHLSGGQKTRVVLASLTFARPHILILDEPTNHLDYESVQALLEALVGYEGGVVLVSHDRKFMSEVAKELWLLKSHKLTRYEGTVESYAAEAAEEEAREERQTARKA